MYKTHENINVLVWNVSKKYSVVYAYSVLFVVIISLEIMYCNVYHDELSVGEESYCILVKG